MNDWRELDCSTTEGRAELNRVIARRLGYEIYTAEVGFGAFSADREWLYEWIYKDDQPIEVPEYTTDLNAAAVLLKGFPVIQIEELPDADTDDSLGWSVYIQRNGVSGQANGGESLPLAICKAWLNWRTKQVNSSNPDIP